MLLLSYSAQRLTVQNGHIQTVILSIYCFNANIDKFSDELNWPLQCIIWTLTADLPSHFMMQSKYSTLITNEKKAKYPSCTDIIELI